MKSLKKRTKALLLSLALLTMPVISVQAASAGPQSEDAAVAKAYTGWFESGGYRYYYQNGVKLTGWQTINGYRFYFDKYGRALTGWQTIGGYRFYFNPYGRALTGWQKISGYYYYFNSYGRALTGWQTLNGQKYYFYSNGRAATGTLTLSGTRYTFNERGRVLSSTSSNPSVRRAVVIGERNYTRASTLIACEYDAKAMTSMLKKTGYSSVTQKINASKATIKNAISSTFAAADSNDVSLFYYSGHGASSGALYTVDDNYIYTSTLADWLKSVPGTVVVILDSCYSGAVINKSADGVVSVKSANEFNNNVINAFAKVNSTAKSGEMCTSKFQVLTACKMTQTSLAYSTYYGTGYSLFTDLLVSGVGYNYSGTKLGTAPADLDSNAKLSLHECWRYTYMNTYDQDSQCYPTNSSFTLFTRY